MKHVLALLGVILAFYAFFYMIKTDHEVGTFAIIKEQHIKAHTTINNVSNAHKYANNEDKSLETPSKNINLTRANYSNNFTPSKLYKLSCASCHANSATGLIGPSLRTLSAKQIKQALLDFKNGKRINKAMDLVVKKLSLDDINALANSISGPLKGK